MANESKDFLQQQVEETFYTANELPQGHEDEGPAKDLTPPDPQFKDLFSVGFPYKEIGKPIAIVLPEGCTILGISQGTNGHNRWELWAEGSMENKPSLTLFVLYSGGKIPITQWAVNFTPSSVISPSGQATFLYSIWPNAQSHPEYADQINALTAYPTYNDYVAGQNGGSGSGAGVVLVGEEQGMISAGDEVQLDSSLIVNDTDIYKDFGSWDHVYTVMDVAMSGKGAKIVQVRNDRDIAQWVDVIYFKRADQIKVGVDMGSSKGDSSAVYIKPAMEGFEGQKEQKE